MKKITLTKKTKIYIMAPANTFTGGPELLHQLAFSLKKIFKADVFMFYLPSSNLNFVHKKFKKYNLNYSSHIEDDFNNILIIPEHFMFLRDSLKYKKIRKILWWLSIDNFFAYKFRYDFNKYIRSIIKVPFNLIKLFNFITNYYFGMITYHDFLKIIYKSINIKEIKELKQIDLHLTQSIYASHFLKKYFLNSKYLSDFQRPEIIKNKSKNFQNKKDLICYSGKSNNFLEKIKKVTKLKMIKLSNLNDKQIISIFKKTKLYLDFGYHPGKDRMPREAVLFNNCIITNYRGSAKNKHDIPINEKYKFTENYSNLKKIKLLIFNILKNYKKEFKNFKTYKKKILQEKNNFNKDLKKIFIKKK